MKTTFIVLAIFMCLDILTGVGTALKNGKFKSGVMKEGMWSKAAEVGMLVLATLLDNALPLIGITYEAHFGILATAYLTIMEVGSIAENLARINPKLASVLSQIMDIVDPHKEEEKDETV